MRGLPPFTFEKRHFLRGLITLVIGVSMSLFAADRLVALSSSQLKGSELAFMVGMLLVSVPISMNLAGAAFDALFPEQEDEE